MKTEVKKPFVSETRKIRKPLMEKKRRARINDSLETLKQILLESKTTLKESSSKKSGQRTAKLEKADILEMTVRYLQHLQNKLKEVKGSENKTKTKEKIVVSQADSSVEALKMGVTLIPTKLTSGEIVFMVPSTLSQVSQSGCYDYNQKSESVWRPW